MALVKFVACTSAAFLALKPKDADTLYFVEEERRLYKGDVPYSGGIYKAVESFPESGEVNTLYINTSTGEVKFWNGTAYTQVVKPFTATVTESDTTHLPTAKAVADYVATKVQAAQGDISALTKRVEANETAVKTTLPQAISKAQTDAQAHADSKVQELANGTVATNTNKIAALEKGKADKSTTLAGYGIGDAYTKAQADSAIAAAIANAPHLKREIVEQLPETSSANENTIYMVGKGEGAETSVYKEYMLINGKFELLGDSKVDLTNYATKSYADSKATEAQNAAIADATGKIATAKQEAIDTAAADAKTKAEKAKNDAIAAAGTAADGKIATEIGKLDVADAAVEGQYVSSVSETDGKIKVTRAALPAAATLVTGTENGTVKFNGTDVPVAGLKSAAFQESTAFDSKGSAATAESNAKSHAETKATEALNSAKEYANGLASNYATAAQGAKADTALQPTDIKESTVNGTITVKGTNVKVHGLGSAAYANTDAFDSHGSADKAQAEAIKQAKAYTDAEIIKVLTWGTIGQ